MHYVITKMNKQKAKTKIVIYSHSGLLPMKIQKTVMFTLNGQEI